MGDLRGDSKFSRPLLVSERGQAVGVIGGEEALTEAVTLTRRAWDGLTPLLRRELSGAAFARIIHAIREYDVDDRKSGDVEATLGFTPEEREALQAVFDAVGLRPTA